MRSPTSCGATSAYCHRSLNLLLRLNLRLPPRPNPKLKSSRNSRLPQNRQRLSPVLRRLKQKSRQLRKHPLSLPRRRLPNHNLRFW